MQNPSSYIHLNRAALVALLVKQAQEIEALRFESAALAAEAMSVNQKAVDLMAVLKSKKIKTSQFVTNTAADAWRLA